MIRALQPGMHAVGAYGEHLLTGNPPRGEVRKLFFPPAVSLTLLTLATTLSVYKPWGRFRRTSNR
ncbi:hypothetical protein AB0L06_34800 [Spirillospora sp. NPDC052269]